MACGVALMPPAPSDDLVKMDTERLGLIARFNAKPTGKVTELGARVKLATQSILKAEMAKRKGG